MSKIILRNSTIPASGREIFTTAVDNQSAVDIHVLQGERELAADCRSLARFKLRGIPPMPAGLPRIEVRFQIDANGILAVAALQERLRQLGQLLGLEELLRDRIFVRRADDVDVAVARAGERVRCGARMRGLTHQRGCRAERAQR